MPKLEKWLLRMYILVIEHVNVGICIYIRGVPIWEFWVLQIPIIFLSESTDTSYQSDIDHPAHVKQ